MQKRRLGRSELEVAPVAFGGNVFGWTIGEQQSFEILDAFIAAGFNFIDTADVYAYWKEGNTGGESETIIGRWMASRGNRDKIILATKVGSGNREHGKDISGSYIIKTVEESLARLKTDYIDLYQTHWDVEDTPVEETLAAYQQLIEQGKVRYIGASNLSPARLEESLKASEREGLPRYETFQPHYNLYEREVFEKELEQICLDHELGVINYWALAAGFLTGKYRSEQDLAQSPRGEGVRQYLDERGFRILKALDEVAARQESVPATVALAWLLARPSVTAPIASATSLRQLDTLIKAPELSLSPDDLSLLDQASAWK